MLKYNNLLREMEIIRGKTATFEFTNAEINFLKEIIFEAMKDLKWDDVINDDGDSDRVLKPDNYYFLEQIMEERRKLVEVIYKKLIFDI
jgi:hypothetical protein